MEIQPAQATASARGPAQLEELAQLDEGELINAAKRRENLAFEVLMRRYNRRLFRVARSILRDEGAAEDAVQECYVRAFTHLDRYQPTGSFGAWLTRLAINEALMLKRRNRRALLSLEEFEHLSERVDAELEALTTPDSVDTASARQLLETAIDTLPQIFRTVFVLRAIEQLSTTETAECLGINESTVKTRLHRAQLRLRDHIVRRLRREHLSLFEFAGARCDRIVAHVLSRLSGGANASISNRLA